MSLLAILFKVVPENYPFVISDPHDLGNFWTIIVVQAVDVVHNTRPAWLVSPGFKRKRIDLDFPCPQSTTEIVYPKDQPPTGILTLDSPDIF